MTLAAILLLTTLVRFKLLEIPLERDEGAYAYAGKMLFQGVSPYSGLHFSKLPGLFLAYGLITAAFGFSAQGVHCGLLVFNTATTVVLFFLTRKLFDDLSAVVAAGAYASLSLSPNVFGFATHATQLLVLPGLASMILLLKALESGKRRWFFLSGLLAGTAFLIKQQGMYFTLFCASYLIFARLAEKKSNLRRTLGETCLLLMGSALPYALVVMLVLQSGGFGNFWFWTFELPTSHSTRSKTLLTHILWLTYRFKQITEGQIWPWVFGAFGIATLRAGSHELRAKVFVIAFLLFMFAGVCTGYEYYPHYFVLLLPPLAILNGQFVSELTRRLRARMKLQFASGMAFLLFSPALFGMFYSYHSYPPQSDPGRFLRQRYGSNPFPEAKVIGEFIKSTSDPGDEIAIFGSEPEILVYADRRSASGHLIMYPLEDGNPWNGRLQGEMIRDVTESEPEFIVLVGCSTSWLSSRPKPRLLEWAGNYVEKREYLPVQVVDIYADRTIFKYGREARSYQPKADSWLVVLRKPRPKQERL